MNLKHYKFNAINFYSVLYIFETDGIFWGRISLIWGNKDPLKFLRFNKRGR
jgi:hypothetical protein